MSIQDFLRFVSISNPRGAKVAIATYIVINAIFMQSRPLADQPGGLSESGTIPSTSELWHSAI